MNSEKRPELSAAQSSDTPSQSHSVTLEALLRLKRLEKPAPEFWTQFESQLRAKQLAAIVEKRPRWASFARNFSLLIRYQVPIGAVAAIAVAWAGFHGYRAMTLGHDGSAVAYIPLTAPAEEGAVAPLKDAGLSESDRSADVAREVSREVTGGGQQVSANAQPTAANVLPAAYTAPRGEFSQGRWSGYDKTPSERSIAANLAAAQAAEPGFAQNFLGLSQNFDARLVPDRPPVTEPLARMTPPSQERRSRLMSAVLPVAAVATEHPILSSDGFVGRLSDDRLYNSISRYKVAGGELSIKF